MKGWKHAIEVLKGDGKFCGGEVESTAESDTPSDSSTTRHTFYSNLGAIQVYISSFGAYMLLMLMLNP